MEAKQLQQQLNISLLWFGSLVFGCAFMVWLILSGWPDDAEVFWLVRALVLATHLLIWRHSVGRLYDLNLTGAQPTWLTIAHNTWMCLLMFFQTVCIVCLPIADLLSFGAVLD
jgi:hypothetical protein